VAGGKFINLIAYCSDPSLQAEWERGPWVVEAEQEEILHQYRDFEPEVQALIKVRGTILVRFGVRGAESDPGKLIVCWQIISMVDVRP
jgi:hypothetical protein